MPTSRFTQTRFVATGFTMPKFTGATGGGGGGGTAGQPIGLLLALTKAS